MELKDKLRGLREEKGLTRDDVALYTGMAPTNISNYERGDCKPSCDNLQKLAKCYNVSVDYLLDVKAKPMITISGEEYERLKRYERIIKSLLKEFKDET